MAASHGEFARKVGQGWDLNTALKTEGGGGTMVGEKETARRFTRAASPLLKRPK